MDGEMHTQMASVVSSTPFPASTAAMEDPRMSKARVEKLKRRIIRAVANKLTQNPDENEMENMWSMMQKYCKCDCKVLWKHMRAVTLKKLKRLLSADDRVDDMTAIARLTLTDWLLYDLVLVHENIDVIGQEVWMKTGEAQEPLVELFFLVDEYQIETLTGKELIEAWLNLTREYNESGRKCSPMLLQKRWYQLKEATRKAFYVFWCSFRGKPALFEKSAKYKPTPLQLDIAKRYRYLIVTKFPEWSELIKEKKVILAHEFDNHITSLRQGDKQDQAPDLQLVEQKVDIIDLEDSDSEQSNGVTHNAIKSENVDLTEETDLNFINTLNIPCESPFDNTETPLVIDCGDVFANSESRDGSRRDDDNLDDSNILMNTNNINDHVSAIVARHGSDITDTDALYGACIKEDSSDSNITEITDIFNSSQIQIETPFFKSELSPNRRPVQERFDLDDTSLPKIQDVKSMDILENFEEIPNDLQFVDDGIVLEDGEEKANDIIENTNELASANYTPDLKVLMLTTVCMKKLDDMDVFKHLSFNNVRSKLVIERAEIESKPVNLNAVKIDETNMNAGENEPIQSENNSNVNNTSSDNELSINSNRVDLHSKMFKKPHVDNYNPIQLCKNPDFNTRLKRLTTGFLSYEKNREYLKRCYPVTIDLQKSFEWMHINDTIYLNTNKTRIGKDDNFIKTEKVKKLHENIIFESNNDFVKEEVASVPTHSKRRKVIHLPDISEIRRVNQNLLTAEVTPLQYTNYKEHVNNCLFDGKRESSNVPGAVTHLNLDRQSRVDVNPVLVQDTVSLSNFGPAQMVKGTGVSKSKNTNSSKPPPSSSKTQKPAWNNPEVVLPKAEDNLLTSDTVDKMLALLSGQDTKAKKKKRSVQCKKIQARIPERSNGESKCVEKMTSRINNQQSKRHTISKTNHSEDALAALSISQEKKKIKVCCWAQRKILHPNLTRKHPCKRPFCTCCCKDKLLENYKKRRAAALARQPPLSQPNEVNFIENDVSVKKLHINIRTVEKEQPSQAIDSVRSIIVDGNTNKINVPKFIIRHNDIYYTDSLPSKSNAVKSNVRVDIVSSIQASRLNINLTNTETHESTDTTEHDSIQEPIKQSDKAIIVGEKLPETRYDICNDLQQQATAHESTDTSEHDSIQEPLKHTDKATVVGEKLPESRYDICNDDLQEQATTHESTDTTEYDIKQEPLKQIDKATKVNDKPQESRSDVCNDVLRKQATTHDSTYTIQYDITQEPLKQIDKATKVDEKLPESRSIVRNDVLLERTRSKLETPKKNTLKLKKNIIKVKRNTVRFKNNTVRLKKNDDSFASPIYLGENKILLSTIRGPKAQSAHIDPPKVTIPKGVNFILLPNKELALSIAPGVELATEQLRHLELVIEGLQKVLGITGSVGFIKTDNQQDSAKDNQNTPLINKEIIKSQITVDEGPKNTLDSSENIPNVDSTVCNTDLELSEKSVNTEKQTTDPYRKTILSDLMEMSGISEEDAKLPEPVVLPGKVPDIPCINNETALAEMQPNLLRLFNNPVAVAALKRRPDLSILTAYSDLRYAILNNGQFYKMDVCTGEIDRINVFIKHKDLKKVKPNQEELIDLTSETDNESIEDNLGTRSSHLKSSLQNAPYQNVDVITTPFKKSRNLDCILKPFKRYKTKAKSLSILNQKPTQSINTNMRVTSGNSIANKNIVNVTNLTRRKQDLKKIVKTYSIQPGDPKLGETSNINQVESSSDSDDEPLAKKANRGRDTELNCINEDTGRQDPHLSTVGMECEVIEFESHDTDEDCILGV